MAEHVDRAVVTETPKKRIRHERKKEQAKKMKLSTHERGDDCQCRLECFENFSETEMDDLIEHFNSVSNKDEQDAFLSSFVHVKNVAMRRLRADEDVASFNNDSYEYRGRFIKEGQPTEQKVCHKAFIALFGITNRRVQTIKAALTKTGRLPVDMRGKHSNRPNQLSPAAHGAIINHFSSFRGRKSHYSLGATRRIYLPEELNISKMHDMFMRSHRAEMAVSYESYRTVFHTKFNIGFGYPRKDTCSTCDELNQKIEHFEAQTNPSTPVPNLRALVEEKEIHQRKAQTFYNRKSSAKTRARADLSVEALVFHFQKNLNVPNKSANDIYYKRQLRCYSFNIHVLSSDDAYFYFYDETVAKKGADHVCSMLYNFIEKFLLTDIVELELFCDGCAGQNKNYTIIRFFHWLVNSQKKFLRVTVRFPIGGHSYLECDRDMALVKQQSDVDIPQDWHQVFRGARVRPTPFKVINCEKELFQNFSEHLKLFFRATCPFKTRPVRELIFDADHPQYVSSRNSWNGAIETAVIVQRRLNTARCPPVRCLYTAPIPPCREKYEDLQCLKKLCKPTNHDFFKELPVVGKKDHTMEIQTLIVII